MEPLSFIATSAEEAVAQIRQRLGPEAIVLNVRRLPPNGLARFWQKPMIEVLAAKPGAAPAPEPEPLVDALAEFRHQLAEIKEQVSNRPVAESVLTREEIEPPLQTHGWRVGEALRKSGLQPLHTQTIIDKLRAAHGEIPPATVGEEICCAREILAESWRSAAPVAAKSLHILVGAAGSGKTTYLCKWLTQAVLMEGRTARVWRLDGATANMAESLSVHCEILGAPHERSWSANGALAEDLGFIDLPGVDWRKPAALKELAQRLKTFGQAQVHLVLNGAYDTSILLAQYRAFSVLPLTDMVITHLDEETAWGKLWNLVLGTNCSIRHLSAGQNIPGDLSEASANLIFSRQFPGKQAGNRLANHA
jgi:flagellar biosynthesis protein FlhF